MFTLQTHIPVNTRGIHWMMVGAMLLVSACHSDEADEQSLSTPIAFSSQTEEMAITRAGFTGEMDDTQLRSNFFGVFAYHTGSQSWNDFSPKKAPNFIYNQLIEYVAYGVNAWTYDPVKYWPNDNQPADDQGAQGSLEKDLLSFFAYAPYVALTQDTNPANDAIPTSELSTAPAERTGIIAISGNGATDATGIPTITYRLAPDVANQVDLLWGTRGKESYVQADGRTNTADLATTPLNTDLAKQAVGERVDFLFRHALTCIDVYVVRVYDEPLSSGKQPEGEATKIFVNYLTLAMPAEGMYTSGKFDLTTGNWTGAETNSTRIDFSVDAARIQSNLLGTASADDATVRSVELDKYATATGVDETMRRLTRETFATMLIPVSTGAGGIQVTPSVSYSFVTRDDALDHSTLTDRDGHKYVRILHEVTGSPVTIGTYDSGTGNYSLERGKRYILVCYIGVESVRFEVESVEDWDFPLRFQTVGSGLEYSEKTEEKTVNQGD